MAHGYMVVMLPTQGWTTCLDLLQLHLVQAVLVEAQTLVAMLRAQVMLAHLAQVVQAHHQMLPKLLPASRQAVTSVPGIRRLEQGVKVVAGALTAMAVGAAALSQRFWA